jgi:hypothetical protein
VRLSPSVFAALSNAATRSTTTPQAISHHFAQRGRRVLGAHSSPTASTQSASALLVTDGRLAISDLPTRPRGRALRFGSYQSSQTTQ